MTLLMERPHVEWFKEQYVRVVSEFLFYGLISNTNPKCIDAVTQAEFHKLGSEAYHDYARVAPCQPAPWVWNILISDCFLTLLML